MGAMKPFLLLLLWWLRGSWFHVPLPVLQAPGAVFIAKFDGV